MKNSKSNSEILQALEGKKFHVDSLGRVVIEDPTVLQMIHGASGNGFNEIPDPFWNGACSNQRC